MTRKISAARRVAARRRRRRLVASALLTVTGFVTVPTVATEVAHAFERYVVAEARGDTAHDIAARVGRALGADPPSSPGRVKVVPIEGSALCTVAHTGQAVDCAATVRVRRLADGWLRVVVKRHGERAAVDVKIS